MLKFALGLRSALDKVYLASGVIAALFLIAILVLIVIQMLARWTGEVFPGAPDYAGYCMAAASFFAFAHALNRGAHIRVSMLLNAVGPKVRRILETWCFAIGTALAWYFTLLRQQEHLLVLEIPRCLPGPGRHPLVDPTALHGHRQPHFCHRPDRSFDPTCFSSAVTASSPTSSNKAMASKSNG